MDGNNHHEQSLDRDLHEAVHEEPEWISYEDMQKRISDAREAAGARDPVLSISEIDEEYRNGDVLRFDVSWTDVRPGSRLRVMIRPLMACAFHSRDILDEEITSRNGSRRVELRLWAGLDDNWDIFTQEGFLPQGHGYQIFVDLANRRPEWAGPDLILGHLALHARTTRFAFGWDERPGSSLPPREGNVGSYANAPVVIPMEERRFDILLTGAEGSRLKTMQTFMHLFGVDIFEAKALLEDTENTRHPVIAIALPYREALGLADHLKKGGAVAELREVKEASSGTWRHAITEYPK